MNGLLKSVLNYVDILIEKFDRNGVENYPKLGLGLGIASIGLTAVATVKVTKIIKETKNDIQEDLKEGKNLSPEGKEKVTKHVIKTTAKAVGEASLYIAPVVITKYLSHQSYVKAIGMLKEENVLLKEENYRLAGIAAGTLKLLNDYRKKWQEKVGKEEEEKVYYGLEEQEIEYTENGVTKKKKVLVSKNTNGYYDKTTFCYAPWTSTSYIDTDRYGCDHDMNLLRVKGAMSTIEAMLMTIPKVTMNDVARDILSMPEAVEWESLILLKGERLVYNIIEVHQMYEGKMIPIYYIETNFHPYCQEDLLRVLPSAPDYKNELAYLKAERNIR